MGSYKETVEIVRKLTPQELLKIQTSISTQGVLATMKQYNLSYSVVQFIKQGK